MGGEDLGGRDSKAMREKKRGGGTGRRVLPFRPEIERRLSPSGSAFRARGSQGKKKAHAIDCVKHPRERGRRGERDTFFHSFLSSEGKKGKIPRRYRSTSATSGRSKSIRGKGRILLRA